MQSQLKVIKTDGSIEEYLHTKIIGTIANALSEVGADDMTVAEQLAEVVTYYLYHKKSRRDVTSDEIFSVVKAVLADTGYEEAAIALNEHRFERRLKRGRLEVISFDICRLADAQLLCETHESCHKSGWDKSRIVDDLVTEHGLSKRTARMIAGMVEQKILNMPITRVPTSLIKQLVCNDTAAILHAQRQLQMV